MELSKNENSGVVSIVASTDIPALFKTADPTNCKLMDYSLTDKDGNAISSGTDLYKILGIAARTTETEAIKFDASFVPANGVVERAVEFKMKVWNAGWVFIKSGGCIETGTKRIGAQLVDSATKKYTATVCSNLCLSVTGCKYFQHTVDGLRCEFYKAADCTYSTYPEWRMYKNYDYSKRTAKNTVSKSFKINVYDCSSKTVSLVDPSKPILETTIDYSTVSGISTIKTQAQARALFQTNDPACPIYKYELLTNTGGVIRSWELTDPGRKTWT